MRVSLILCVDAGQAYSLGRAEYGRLGLGAGAEEKSEPTPVPGVGPAQGDRKSTRLNSSHL